MPLSIISNPKVQAVFDDYPEHVRPMMMRLRKLILEAAEEMEEITSIEETLRWGEPSFITKQGSTLRMDYKPKTPDQYAMYFSCSSRLVETFKAVFNNLFQYEGKRAIVFGLDNDLPQDELKSCIRAALTYHKVKHLPTLGI